jgi:DNA-binding beta-propeller fold protein YncE
VGTPFSTISAYTINSTSSQLQPITGSPYTVGSGPVCMVEDSSNQYMYVSNHNDGTVTGKVIDPATGILSNLSRGATFPAVGQAECLVLSGVVE